MFTKLVRIGRDAELKHTANGKSVIGLACVYDIGWGDNKKGQWIEVSIWGKQAEALAPYLLKGKQIVIYADDVELETYQKNDGTSGSKLKARAVNIDLTSGQQSAPSQGAVAPQQQRPMSQQAAPQQQPAPMAQAQGFDNSFDDSMPF